jgi:hypothetical protein
LVITQLKLHILLLKISKFVTLQSSILLTTKKETMTHSSCNNKNSCYGGHQGWGSSQGQGSHQGHVGGPVNLQQQQ